MDEKEIERLEGRFRHEHPLWELGYGLVAGVDEAGRGPLAGPVTAAAVILRPGTYIQGLDDSKVLTPHQRESLFQEIVSRALALNVCSVGVEYIDRANILQATYEAMRRAVRGLRPAPDHLLVDALSIPGLAVPQRGIIGGDGLSNSIAAASIIAKVTRDRLMIKLDARYPQYGFARNKGYCTREHALALRRIGPCPAHRRSFLGWLEQTEQGEQAEQVE